jgi:hypothetical protein
MQSLAVLLRGKSCRLARSLLLQPLAALGVEFG